MEDHSHIFMALTSFESRLLFCSFPSMLSGSVFRSPGLGSPNDLPAGVEHNQQVSREALATPVAVRGSIIYGARLVRPRLLHWQGELRQTVFLGCCSSCISRLPIPGQFEVLSLRLSSRFDSSLRSRGFLSYQPGFFALNRCLRWTKMSDEAHFLTVPHKCHLTHIHGLMT
ncbi:hypothetical protein BJY00DRAFT_71514 [Aspergillus carlsbadensis]|nr:hypothetical protein BJY00DRAFT_71514 [Aspergillus carlsbadensis]